MCGGEYVKNKNDVHTKRGVVTKRRKPQKR
jgi:hypothetical protein